MDERRLGFLIFGILVHNANRAQTQLYEVDRNLKHEELSPRSRPGSHRTHMQRAHVQKMIKSFSSSTGGLFYRDHEIGGSFPKVKLKCARDVVDTSNYTARQNLETNH
jgi:hypothetical protein